MSGLEAGRVPAGGILKKPARRESLLSMPPMRVAKVPLDKTTEKIVAEKSSAASTIERLRLMRMERAENEKLAAAGITRQSVEESIPSPDNDLTRASVAENPEIPQLLQTQPDKTINSMKPDRVRVDKPKLSDKEKIESEKPVQSMSSKEKSSTYNVENAARSTGSEKLRLPQRIAKAEAAMKPEALKFESGKAVVKPEVSKLEMGNSSGKLEKANAEEVLFEENAMSEVKSDIRTGESNTAQINIGDASSSQSSSDLASKYNISKLECNSLRQMVAKLNHDIEGIRQFSDAERESYELQILQLTNQNEELNRHLIIAKQNEVVAKKPKFVVPEKENFELLKTSLVENITNPTHRNKSGKQLLTDATRQVLAMGI